MPSLRDLSGALRSRFGARRSGASGPWTPLRKPLTDCTLAIVSSSAYADAAPLLDAPGVELCDFRFVDDGLASAAPAAQADGAARRDDADFEAGRLGAVVDRARTLEATGRVGRLNRRHLVLSGAVDSRRRLIERTRQAAARLMDDHVDVVLLVPM